MNQLFSKLLKCSALIPLTLWTHHRYNAIQQSNQYQQAPNHHHKPSELFPERMRFDNSKQLQTFIEQMYLVPLDYSLSNFKLFQLDTGTLGKQVAAHLDIDLGKMISERFNDGQCNLQILNSVRGQNVYLIKGFGERKINDGIIELILAINSLKKQGAQRVTCIVPFFPYCEGVHYEIQDTKNFFTCFGSDILKLLEDAGCDQVITFNSLMSYPKGFVNKCTFVNINAPDLFVAPLAFKKLRNPILVSSQINTPNFNSLHIIKNAMKYLNYDCPISTFSNKDQAQNQKMEYVGEDVKNRDVILYSTIMRSGKTFIEQSKMLKKMGAGKIYGCTFHNLCEGQQLPQVLEKSAFKQILTTNSLPHGHQYKRIRQISLARIIAETIVLSQEEKSLSEYRLIKDTEKKQIVEGIKSFNKIEKLYNFSNIEEL